MSSPEQIVSTAVEQIKDLLNKERVVGEAITIGDATIIPLMSIGVGFGGGGGTDGSSGSSESGHGAGAGGGAQPVALVISAKHGVRLEPVKPHGNGLASSISEIAKAVAEQQKDKKKDEKDSSPED